MKTYALSSFLCWLASTEGFVVFPPAASPRYTEINPSESRGDAATRAPLRSKTVTPEASRNGPGAASSSRLFAKATYKNFEDMLEKEPGAILVDFYATWCGPCTMMAENLAVIGPKMKDELKIFKIDTDKYPKLMAKFGVNGLPTLVLFKDGKELQRIEGVLPAEPLMQQLRYFLAGAAAGNVEASSKQEGDACSPPPPQDACAPPPRDACAPPKE